MKFPTSSSITAAVLGLSATTQMLLLSQASHVPAMQNVDSHLPTDDILCRMTLFDTMYDNDDSDDEEALHSHQVACIPVVNGTESDDLLPLDNSFPVDDLAEAHQNDLASGSLFVNISHVKLTMGDLETTTESEFTVLDIAPEYYQRQQMLQRHRHLGKTNGVLTFAIVRISTRDSRSTLSNRDMEAMWDERGINFVTQFQRCSFGKLQFRKARHHLIDVTVNRPVASFQNKASLLVSAAQELILQRYRVDHMPQIANHVLVCLPPGLGSHWVASAGMNHWRSQYNDQWCRSLSATMHELGHNLGLPHANYGGIKYGDRTGIMTKSYLNTNWPRRCFNGRHNHLLGWFDELRLDPTRTRSPTTIHLAALVHYDKAVRQRLPVLVNLSNKVWLQFNRAALFNADPGDMWNKVTIHAAGHGGSDLLGGVRPGQQLEVRRFAGSGQTLVIRGCQAVGGSDTTMYPDVMVISVGMGRAYCETEAPVPVPTKAPAKAELSMESDTEMPTVPTTTGAPIRKPTNEPTIIMPTVLDTVEPTLVPTVVVLTKEPTETPTITPTTVVPTWGPTDRAPIASTLFPTVPSTGSPTSSPSMDPTEEQLMPTLAPIRSTPAPSTGMPTIVTLPTRPPAIGLTQAPTIPATLTPTNAPARATPAPSTWMPPTGTPRPPVIGFTQAPTIPATLTPAMPTSSPAYSTAAPSTSMPPTVTPRPPDIGLAQAPTIPATRTPAPTVWSTQFPTSPQSRAARRTSTAPPTNPEKGTYFSGFMLLLRRILAFLFSLKGGKDAEP